MVDPTRDWNLDNGDTVNTLTLYADLLKAIKKMDIRLSYDLIDSDNPFVFGGPRIEQLNTNTTVTGSPPLFGRRVGLLHPFTRRRDHLESIHG